MDMISFRPSDDSIQIALAFIILPAFGLAIILSYFSVLSVMGDGKKSDEAMSDAVAELKMQVKLTVGTFFN